MDPLKDVKDFHAKLGFPLGDGDLSLPILREPEMLRLKMILDDAGYTTEALRHLARETGSDTVMRLSLLAEEWHELLVATFGDGGPNAVAMLDALVDMDYLSLGTAVAFGWDWDEAWRRVHTANMTKTPAEREGGKAVKPKGWKAPDLGDLVK